VRTWSRAAPPTPGAGCRRAERSNPLPVLQPSQRTGSSTAQVLAAGAEASEVRVDPLRDPVTLGVDLREQLVAGPRAVAPVDVADEPAPGRDVVQTDPPGAIEQPAASRERQARVDDRDHGAVLRDGTGWRAPLPALGSWRRVGIGPTRSSLDVLAAALVQARRCPVRAGHAAP
jgi:hypothetical protein